MGHKMGIWVFYYKNGNKESTGRYTKDEKVGNWIYYTRNGSILDKVDEDTGKSLIR